MNDLDLSHSSDPQPGVHLEAQTEPRRIAACEYSEQDIKVDGDKGGEYTYEFLVPVSIYKHYVPIYRSILNTTTNTTYSEDLCSSKLVRG